MCEAMPDAKVYARVLLITREVRGRGGREQLSRLLRENLDHITEEKIEEFQLPFPKVKTSIIDRLFGRIDGITAEAEEKLLKHLAQLNLDLIIIDGSNLGRLARLLRKAGVTHPIATFYHNVEAHFFFDALRVSLSLRSLAVLVANIVAERWATQYSDFRVMLNNRDSQQLRKVYGRLGTHILPMIVPDLYDPKASQTPSPLVEKYALFVGGAFYANVEGLAWYAKKIAPFSPIQTVVIGRGMEVHRSRLEKWGGVRVIGEVEDLAPWYAHAQIIVAPILSGSGMKTKTAEALMYGKPVVGTPEAFVGYRLGWTDHLKSCEEPEQFIDVLKHAANAEARFECSLRAHYEEHHSIKAMQGRLNELLWQALQDNKLRNPSLSRVSQLL